MFTDKRFFGAHCGVIAGASMALLTTITSANALTLQQALERAQAASPRLEALRAQRLAAEARIGGAAALPDPKLQLTYFGESVQTRTGPQESIYAFSQTVPWPKKLSTRKALASSQANLMAHRYQLGSRDLQREVTHTYVEIAYLQKAVESTQANLDLIADTYAIVEEQVRGGKSLNALLRLEVEREHVSDQLDRRRQQAVEQRANLAAMLSLEATALGHRFDLPDEGAVTSDSSRLMERIVASNPDLQALRQQIASSDVMLQLSRLDRYPDFTLGLSYIQVGRAGAAPDAGKDPWAVTVAVNLPIWETKTRSAIAAARASQRALEQHYLERELQLKAELSSLLARRADNTKRKARYQEQLIPLAEQALENSQAAYQSNQLSVLELIDSERALLKLNLNYWRAAANVLQADAAIKALTGKVH